MRRKSAACRPKDCNERQHPGGPSRTDESTGEKWFFSPVFVRLLATNAAFGFSISAFYLLPKHLAVSFAATSGTKLTMKLRLNFAGLSTSAWA